jgi:hypothetical protein
MQWPSNLNDIFTEKEKKSKIHMEDKSNPEKKEQC